MIASAIFAVPGPTAVIATERGRVMDLDELAQRHVEARKPADVPETPITDTRPPIVIQEDADGWPILPECLKRRA